MQAMILAAGFGTRLLPFTEKKAKPLFPLLNVPLLQITIEMLEKAGFDHIIVNVHHLREQFKEIADIYPFVHLQEEEEILGTGGGLRRALDNLKDEPLLITNGDIYHSVNPLKVYEQHKNSECRVTLAVHDFPRFNTLAVEGDSLLGFAGKGKAHTLAFTGIHVIDPVVLEPIPQGEASCIIDRYSKLLAEGEKFSLLRVDDSFWYDIGTPQDYLNIHGELLQGKAPHSITKWSTITGQEIISNNARIGKNLIIKDWVSIGDAVIGDNVTIARSVIWDGAVIHSNAKITDSIITQA